MGTTTQSKKKGVGRRVFIGGSLAAAGGLVVGFYIPSPLQRILGVVGWKLFPPAMKPNAFIEIAADNSITIVSNRLEMGQGIHTALAQLVAEELECDWKKIRATAANADRVFGGPLGMIVTGSSSSVKDGWEQYRRLGAGLREMLIATAAARWKISPEQIDQIQASEGHLVHPEKGRLSYGELAAEASQRPFPSHPKLKAKQAFRIIGQAQRRVDVVEKCNGTAIFGSDVRLPGMLYCVVARPSLAAATLASYHEAAARAIRGVVDVVVVGNKVAVLATQTFAAKQGRDALAATWHFGAESHVSSESLLADFKKLAAEKGAVAQNRGNVSDRLAHASKKIEAEFEFPFLAHAAMEPMNCTVDFNGETAHLYGGFQALTFDQEAAEKILGIARDKIHFHTTYVGGSFGRRASIDADWVSEACAIAKLVKRPLKVCWTREDDMRGGHYRPMVYHKVTLGLDDKNALTAWDHRIVGQSIMKGTALEFFGISGGIEGLLVEGVAETAYDLPQLHVEQSLASTPLSTLWWRSVGNSHSAFVMETLIDELALAAAQDPIEFRRSLLKKAPRHLEVLTLLQESSGWGKQNPPSGRAWGVALHESFGSVVGHIAEVSVGADGPRVHRIWSAVHCGQVINPDGAAAQIEGAIVFGLSAALAQKIELKDGAIVQGNFDAYPVMRLNEMPQIAVAFVPSDAAPSGLGEPGLPAIAPAVANGLYRLTKKRLRILPFSSKANA